MLPKNYASQHATNFAKITQSQVITFVCLRRLLSDSSSESDDWDDDDDDDEVEDRDDSEEVDEDDDVDADLRRFDVFVRFVFLDLFDSVLFFLDEVLFLPSGCLSSPPSVSVGEVAPTDLDLLLSRFLLPCFDFFLDPVMPASFRVFSSSFRARASATSILFASSAVGALKVTSGVNVCCRMARGIDPPLAPSTVFLSAVFWSR
jgi:hypothetical protein